MPANSLSGASTDEHLGTNTGAAKMIYNDEYGNTFNAEWITRSVIQIMELFKGNSSTLDGEVLNLEGINKKQLNKVKDLLNKNGYEFDPRYKQDGDTHPIRKKK